MLRGNPGTHLQGPEAEALFRGRGSGGVVGHGDPFRADGLAPSSLLFDPLTFTIGSGDEDSRNAAVETLSGIRLIKETLPGALTLLGLSNVSFGRKPFARQVLNSVFLSEAILNGLDAAIVSPAKILPLSKLKRQGLRRP